jgi:Icc-related predicted phosphoesterase
MTKLVVISDTHTRHQEIVLPDGDILIHCGDMTNVGSITDFMKIGVWFGSMLHRYKHIICIAGNHDFGLQRHREVILQTAFTHPNIHYLEDSEIELEGIKFWGSPWTPTFYDWAFMKDDEDLKEVWDQIPEDTNVLITHGPPHGILDMNEAGEHCGSKTLRARMEQDHILEYLKVHLFGHIHEGYGHKGRCYNCSSLNRQYKYANPPVVIEV